MHWHRSAALALSCDQAALSPFCAAIPTVLASCLPPLPVQGAVGPAAHAVGMGGQRSVGARVSTLATQCLGARLTWASRRRVLTRCSRHEHVAGWEQIK